MLLLDPLTDESQADVVKAVGEVPALGPGWWDRMPAEPGADDRQAQVARLAAMTGGELA